MIVIRNRFDVPFGVLDNLFAAQIFLDDKMWSSVYEYVFSPHKVPAVPSFDAFFQDNDMKIINEAMYKAIAAKCDQSRDFKTNLLKLGETEIDYIGSSLLYGVDASGNGTNIYGKWLTSAKNALRSTNVESFSEILLLDRTMKKLIFIRPLDEFLQMAKDGKTIGEILKIVEKKYGRVADVPPLHICEQIMKERHRQLDAYSIISNAMKTYTREVFFKNTQMFRLQILATFIDKTKRVHNIENSDLNLNTDVFIKNLEPKERRILEKQIFSHYMSEVKKGNVSKIEPLLYVPSSDEITKNEKLKLAQEKTMSKSKVDHRTSPLSMDHDKDHFVIDKMSFPSITHYIAFELINFHNIYGTNAYSELKINDTEFISVRSVFSKTEKALNAHGQYLVDKLTNAIRAKVDQHVYIRDYIAAAKFRPFIFKTGHNDAITSEIYNGYRDNVNWPTIMYNEGRTLDHVLDPFFSFQINLHFNRFFSRLLCIFPNGFSEDDAIRVYKEFYDQNAEYSSADIYNVENVLAVLTKVFEEKCIGKMDKLFSTLVEQLAYRFMKAEAAAKKYCDDTSVVFMSKFFIVESQYKIFDGLSVNPSAYYAPLEIEKLALLNVVKKICNIRQKEIAILADVDVAYNILTNKCGEFATMCNGGNFIERGNVEVNAPPVSVFGQQIGTNIGKRIETLLKDLHATRDIVLSINKHAELINRTPSTNVYDLYLNQ